MERRKTSRAPYSFSYDPSHRFSSTVKPALLASDIDVGLVIRGVLTEVMTFRTGCLQSGQ